MAAWHMAWNASTAALNDRNVSRGSRFAHQRRSANISQLGKDFLERGIRNNPERPQLYEALARLYRDKYKDHARASEFFAKAAEQPGAHELCETFRRLRAPNAEGASAKPTRQLRAFTTRRARTAPDLDPARLKYLEDQLNILQQRVRRASTNSRGDDRAQNAV